MEDTEVEAGHVFSALTKLDCKLNHNHTRLTSLALFTNLSMTDEDLSDMCSFFDDKNASHLEKLHLNWNISDISKLCEVFNNNRGKELRELTLKSYTICNKDSTARLWDTLCKELCNLNKLNILLGSFLTALCIPKLCNALQDERCQLTDLSLTDLSLKDIMLNRNHCPSCNALLESCTCRLNNLSLTENGRGNDRTCTYKYVV